MRTLSFRERLLFALLVLSLAVVFGVVADVLAFQPTEPKTLLGD